MSSRLQEIRWLRTGFKMAVLLAVAAAPSLGRATVYSYEGTGTTTTPATGNFSGTSFAPTLDSGTATPISTTADTLSFAGGTAYTATDDFTAQTVANALTFTNTAAITLARGAAGTSNSISLGGTAPTVALNNSALVTNALDLALTADTTFTGAGSMTASGVVSGAFGLIKSSTGTLTLTGANTYTGATTINAGTLTINGLGGAGAASPLGASSNAASSLVLGDGATLVINGTSAGVSSTDRSLTLLGAGTVSVQGSTNRQFTSTAAVAYGTVNQARSLTLNASNTGSVSNVFALSIADNGTGKVSLTKTGTIRMILKGTNTYSGPTTITSGDLNPQVVASALSPNSAVVFSGAATSSLTLSVAPVIGSLAGGSSATVGLVNLSTFTLTLGNDNTSTSYGGVITNTGGITKIGTGTQTFTNANTYTGATTITGGILSATGAGTTPNRTLGSTSGVAVSGGGTLLLGAANQFNATTPAPITLGVAATSAGLLSVATGASQGVAAVKANGVAPTTGTTAGLGTLTLNNTATLTYSGAGTTLVFGLFTTNNGSVLNVTGYTNTTVTANGANSGAATDDRLVFSGALAPLTAFSFNGAPAGTGVSEIALDNGFYEVAFVAVPEPGTWAGLLLGAGVLGFVQRRRAARV